MVVRRVYTRMVEHWISTLSVPLMVSYGRVLSSRQLVSLTSVFASVGCIGSKAVLFVDEIVLFGRNSKAFN